MCLRRRITSSRIDPEIENGVLRMRKSENSVWRRPRIKRINGLIFASLCESRVDCIDVCAMHGRYCRSTQPICSKGDSMSAMARGKRLGSWIAEQSLWSHIYHPVLVFEQNKSLLASYDRSLDRSSESVNPRVAFLHLGLHHWAKCHGAFRSSSLSHLQECTDWVMS